MELLERDGPLYELDAALKDAVAGEGRVALVSGEAGIGKTVLVEQFTREHRYSTQVLWGACDALFTPRPLGPLHDIAARTQGNLPTLLSGDANRTALFSAFLSELQGRPTLAVFEDVHWADEATLDLLRFLGRRITHSRALLIITYRDDELGSQHPLRIVLGDLATSSATRRIPLSPLSQEAVRRLAGDRGLDPVALYRQTDGNPFFVTEAIASDSSGIPATVRDAVLARAARLSLSARAVLEAAAIIGARAESWLLAEVTGAEASATEECMAAGMLLAQGDVFAFRHELARQTILDVISPQRRLVLHQFTLAALKGSPAARNDLTRLAHHAEAAYDREAVLEYTPAAARQAAASGAHREAAAHYRTSLKYIDVSTAEIRAGLLDGLVHECRLAGGSEEAYRACREARDLWQIAGRRDREGACVALLSNLAYNLGQRAEGNELSDEAIRILEALPPGPELAMAYGHKCMRHTLSGEYEAAKFWGIRAIKLAEHVGATEALTYTLNSLGTLEINRGDEAGWPKLERSLQLSLANDLPGQAARAYANLGANAINMRQYARAERALAQGLAYVTPRDMDRWVLFIKCYRAKVHLARGRLREAQDDAAEILRSGEADAQMRREALTVLGQVHVRRGEPEAEAVLDEALEIAQALGDLYHLAPVASARAQAAWLAGYLHRTADESRACFEKFLNLDEAWDFGDLSLWMWRAGEIHTAPAQAARPYALQMSGDWRGAAAEWERIGSPYEQALALADGDEAAQLAALDILERLGAKPAAERVRGKLVALSARRLEKGKFGGLTEREREVAALIAQGKSNRQIAEALVVGTRTVETHVTRILNKLGFNSRVQIATWAVEKGLAPPPGALNT